ncbi:MAG: WD40 repeat domain-containing protein [Planctomycetia bacterium]|nr:WD40 repeat domain-containing protein [Planctomycetia bacterium]
MAQAKAKPAAGADAAEEKTPEPVESIFEIYRKAYLEKKNRTAVVMANPNDAPPEAVEYFGIATLLSAADPKEAILKALKIPEPIVIKAEDGNAGKYDKHFDAVTSLRLSLDGQMVLSGSADKTAHLWNLNDKKTIRIYQDEMNHKQGVTDVEFSPDNRFVLTSSYDQTIRLWNTRTGKNTKAFTGSKDRVWAIGVPMNGLIVAGGCNDGKIYFWNSSSIKRLGELTGHAGPVFSLEFTLDGTRLVSASADFTARIWDVINGEELLALAGHSDKVYSACFSIDGQYVVTASRDKSARLWDAATGDELCRFVGHKGAVRKAFIFGPLVVSCGDDGTIRFWLPNLGKGKKMNVGTRARGGARNAEDYLAGMREGGPDTGKEEDPLKKKKKVETIGPLKRPVGMPKGYEIARIEGPSTAILDLIPTMDGKRLIGACMDGVVRIWNLPAIPMLEEKKPKENGPVQ